jgi:aminoglycoside phosphotransferase (APT) family kinase protein
MHWPPPEVLMDVALVSDLLRRQHPDFADYEIREASAGFDNTIWRLGDDFVVRLPRRAIGAVLMEHELRWLPELAPRLPLQVPTPIRAGQPSSQFAWPWSIAKWIEGSPGNSVRVETLRNGAEQFGRFLRSLHVDAPATAPVNEFRGVPLQRYESSFLTRLKQVGGHVDREAVLEVWRNAIDAPPWSKSDVWLHGDLHPANTIFDNEALVGVIDFGDLCAGDPATDLAGALMSLPFESIEEFFDAYGAVDLATKRRTLGWTVHFGLMFTLLGINSEPSYGPIGRRAIDNARTFSRTFST